MASGLKATGCPKDFLICASLKNGFLTFNPITGQFHRKSSSGENCLPCARYIFVILDQDLKLGLMDCSIKCLAEPDGVHNHDPPPRSLVSLLLMKWQSIMLAIRQMVTPANAMGVIYDGWRGRLPVSKKRTIQYFSRLATTGTIYPNYNSHECNKDVREKWLKNCGPEALAVALKFYKTTLIWPRADSQKAPLVNVDNLKLKKISNLEEPSSSDVVIADVIPGSCQTKESGSQIDSVRDTSTIISSPFGGHIETRKVHVTSKSRNSDGGHSLRMIDDRDDSIELLLSASLRTGELGIDPQTGHFYDHYRRGRWRCARHIFLNIDHSLNLKLMNHDAVECRVSRKGGEHNHGPPPRPLVSMLFLRWYSIIHALWSPVTLLPKTSISAVYKEWIEDLPVSEDRAVSYLKITVASFQKCLESDFSDPVVLKWVEVFGPQVLAKAMTFYSKTPVWPLAEIGKPTVQPGGTAANLFSKNSSKIPVKEKCKGSENCRENTSIAPDCDSNGQKKSFRIAKQKNVTIVLKSKPDLIQTDAARLPINHQNYRMKNFIPTASLQRRILGINPETGHFYDQSNGRCARKVFLNLDKDLDLKLMDHSIVCNAKPTERHNHDPPPRPLVAVLFLRWKSIVHAVWDPVVLRPRESIRAMYDQMKDLPITKERAVKFMKSSVTAYQRHLKNDTDDPMLLRWVTYCGPDSFAVAESFYSETRAWPLKENRELQSGPVDFPLEISEKKMEDPVDDVPRRSRNSDKRLTISSNHQKDSSNSISLFPQNQIGKRQESVISKQSSEEKNKVNQVSDEHSSPLLENGDTSDLSMILNRRGLPSRAAARVAEKRNSCVLLNGAGNRALRSQPVLDAGSSSSVGPDFQETSSATRSLEPSMKEYSTYIKFVEDCSTSISSQLADTHLSTPIAPAVSLQKWETPLNLVNRVDDGAIRSQSSIEYDYRFDPVMKEAGCARNQSLRWHGIFGKYLVRIVSSKPVTNREEVASANGGFSPGARLTIPKPLVGIEKRERSQSMEGNANKRHRMDSFDPDISSTRKDPSPAAVVSKGDVSFESNTESFSSGKVVSSITVPESGNDSVPVVHTNIDKVGEVATDDDVIHRALMAAEKGESLANFDPTLVKMLSTFRNCYKDVLTKIQS